MTEYTTDTLFKVLRPGGLPNNGGVGYWHLPNHGHPGRWMRVISNLQMCWNGYHLTDYRGLAYWAGPVLFTAEWRRGCLVDRETTWPKRCVGQARLLKRVRTWTEHTTRLACLDMVTYLLRYHRPSGSKLPRWQERAQRNGYVLNDAQVKRLLPLINTARVQLLRSREERQRRFPLEQLMELRQAVTDFYYREEEFESRETRILSRVFINSWHDALKATVERVVDCAVAYKFRTMVSENQSVAARMRTMQLTTRNTCGQILLRHLNGGR